MKISGVEGEKEKGERERKGREKGVGKRERREKRREERKEENREERREEEDNTLPRQAWSAKWFYLLESG